MKRIYTDSAAGLQPNPSSLHLEGVKTAEILKTARQEVAAVVGAHPDEIIFTSGGTESNNLAIFGAPAGQILVSAVEHSSVLMPAKVRGNFQIIPVDKEGRVQLEVLKNLLNKNTALVSVMYVNNELGTVQPIEEVAKIIRRFRKQHNSHLPYFHVDACQATRHFNLDVRKLGVDLLTFNGNKLAGVLGAGVLYVKRGVKLKPLLYGGGQEAGRRAGTENVPAITRLAEALTLAQKGREKESKKLSNLRQYFIKEVIKHIPAVELNGSLTDSAPYLVNFSFSDLLGEQVVLELDAKGVAASTGSACATHKYDDSYVILALNKSAERARSAVRFSFSPSITKEEVVKIIKILKTIINNLRQANHAYSANLTL